MDRIREALDVVDIVLGFLSSGGGRADRQLGEYITRALRMKKRFFSEKVGGGSSLHCIQVYLTLNLHIYNSCLCSSRLENTAHWATSSLFGRHSL